MKLDSCPPPIIDCTKVLLYAFNDSDVEYTDRINLYVGQKSSNNPVKLGEVPRLVISQEYYDKKEYFLMFCDEEWVAKGVIPFTTLDEAKIKAERGYKGINKKWLDSAYTQNEIDDYLRDVYEVDPRSEWWTVVCSFCGKKDPEVQAIMVGKNASICNRCITSLHDALNSESRFDDVLK